MLPETRKTLEQYGVNVERTLARFVGDEEMMLQFMRSLPQDESFDQMVQAKQQGDQEAFQFAAHSLKGLSGNLGLTPLFEQCSELMAAIRAGDEEAVDRQYGGVCAEYAHTVEMLKGL
ncbi:MAG: Hpt domain-containing protein [Clostridia bacterium]